MPRPFIAYHPSSPGYYTTTNTSISSSTEKFLVGFFITVIVLLIFLVCSCVRFVSRAGRQVGGITAATVTAAASINATNNSKVVLACLPIFVYNSISHQGNRECAVCLEDFTKGEHCRFLPECSHSFHLECIDMWLHSHSTCPLCRAPLEGQNTKLPA